MNRATRRTEFTKQRKSASVKVGPFLALLQIVCLGTVALADSAVPTEGGRSLSARTMPPAVSSATDGNLSALDLKRGRKLYVAKCAKCHRFYDPTDYTDEEWEKWMASMSEKSKLKPDQEELLSRYLATLRNGGRR